MDYVDQQHARNWANAFSSWERPCRGWTLWDVAVELEPPCSRINPAPSEQYPVTDDARTRGGIRGLVIRNRVSTGIPVAVGTGNAPIPALPTARPDRYYRTGDVGELHLQLPGELDVTPVVSEQLLLSLGHFRDPVSYEIYGDRDAISVQLACSGAFVSHLTTQWKTIVPAVTITRRDGFLKKQFEGRHPSVIADFALSGSFLLPLRGFRTFNPDPLNGLVSSLVPLTGDDRAAFQVLFVPTRFAWSQTLQAIQSDPEQRKLLAEMNPAYVGAIKEKLATPLNAVTIRLMVQSGTTDRAWELIRQIGGSLRQFSHPQSNELIALGSDGYPANNHRLSFFSRTNYRSGFLINTSELASLVHLPCSSIRADKLVRSASKTKRIPRLAEGNAVLLGENIHDGQTRPATLSDEQRSRHVHIVGSTGSGKSTLLLNLIRQDVEAGKGVCVLDPAGDLVDAVCASVPDSRLDDVLLFDPSDTEFPIGFNVLQAHSDLEKTLIASDLVAAFRRMATSWGDVMDATLANGVLALLESSRGGTLIDLKRFLVEKQFREDFLLSVEDEAVRYFWMHEFPLVSRKPQASILIRLDAFLRQKLIRNIVCQKENKLDFRSMMDNSKILLFKLAQGTIGLENAHLLGTLIVTKLHQIALSRQETTNRPFFAIYLDEFHNFVGPSIEPILSGIRKYNVGLHLSHQEFRQLQSRSQEVAASVISNCYTRICFRLGDSDADRFGGGFSYFDAADLQNLGIGEAIGRIERSDNDFNLKTIKPPTMADAVPETKKAELVQRSRDRFAVAKCVAEAEAASGRMVPSRQPPPKPEREVSPIETDGAPDRNMPGVETGEHQYLQRIVKRIAEKYDFIATLEKQVLGGIGRIDVALENGSLKVACEIAVTNTVPYEVQSIQKCTSSGYEKVIVLSPDERHLREIEKAARETIDGSNIDRIAFLKPENFHLYLERLCADLDIVRSPDKVRGYTVVTSYADAPPSAVEQINDAIVEILTEGHAE
ncbi:MAG: type IV secretory system conjugative DNA transfer family protein [Chloracidobacterium sp.]|nr:type IV secretory system conjugative DNA transfer family protein [Chloracidobacterium sp.]